ncbi:Kinesin-like protein KIN-12B isoform F [Glycine soja]|nr:Kinesin-like protein KIN-12B isoform F [Glycine soja]
MGREQQRRGMRNEEVHGWGISSNNYWAEKEREKKQSVLYIYIMAVALTILVTLLSVLSSASCARMVGGKTEIPEVRKNRQVQELGRFAVEEYNLGLKLLKNNNVDNGREQLNFSAVVEAQQQVVSGMKYYLKISATHNGVHEMFNSVVVVKPWLHSKQLLHFAPASSSTTTTTTTMHPVVRKDN